MAGGTQDGLCSMEGAPGRHYMVAPRQQSVLCRGAGRGECSGDHTHCPNLPTPLSLSFFCSGPDPDPDSDPNWAWSPYLSFCQAWPGLGLPLLIASEPEQQGWGRSVVREARVERIK